MNVSIERQTKIYFNEAGKNLQSYLSPEDRQEYENSLEITKDVTLLEVDRTKFCKTI